MTWTKHIATSMGRTIPSDLPIEAHLREMGFARNCAGNFDNWKWRETSPGSIEAYRILSRHEADALRMAILAAAHFEPAVPSSLSNQTPRGPQVDREGSRDDHNNPRSDGKEGR